MTQALVNVIEAAKAKNLAELSNLLEKYSERAGLQKLNKVVVCKEDFPDENILDEETIYLRCGAKQCSIGENRIIYFSDEVKMYSFAYEMMNLLNELEKDWYDKVVETNLRFNDITLKTPDIMMMINYFNEIMSNPVIIYDEFFNITALSHSNMGDYDREGEEPKKFELRNLFYYKQEVTFKMGEMKGIRCNRLLFPVLSEGMPKGYLAIFDTETKYEQMDLMILEIFANAVLTEMRRRLDLQNIEYKFVSDFIYDVIYRYADKEQEIARRAKLLNVSEDADYCFITINPLGRMNNPRFDTNGYITQYEFMSDRILNNIMNFHHKHFEQDIITKFDRSIYILHKVIQDGDESDENLKEICSKMMKQLNEWFDGMIFQIGIGEIVHGLKSVSTSFHQCWATISYGELVNGKSECFVAAYSDNSMLKLFGRLNEINCLDEVVPENLSQICAYDKKYHTQYYETLKVYLDCNCNSKKAAEKLFIHYKTMLYRVEKLKHLFHVDVENSNSRLFLELGIQILDIKNKE